MPHRAWPNCLVLSTLAGPKASWTDPGSIPPFQWPGYPQGRWNQVVQEPTGPGPAISSSRLPRRFSAALLSLSSTSPVTEHKSVLDSLVGATRQHLDQTATRPRTSLRLPPSRRGFGKVHHRRLSGSARIRVIPTRPLRDGPRICSPLGRNPVPGRSPGGRRALPGRECCQAMNGFASMPEPAGGTGAPVERGPDNL